MKKVVPPASTGVGVTNRRSFLRNSAAAGAATISIGLLGDVSYARAHHQDDSRPITKGDIAILRFLQALETIEADLWRQYAELGGATTQPNASPIDLPFPTGLAPAYITGLIQLDGDMPQYIADNTDDELSHESFLKNYLESKGAEIADLTPFKNITPSQVTGVPSDLRLTNLTQLTVDTSWWTRYRSDSRNPDFGDTFPNAIPSLGMLQHTAIPRSNDDLITDPTEPNGIGAFTQAIASTAGFHFAFIEQGGTSLYPQLAQRVTNVEVLRVLLSIGPTEACHFQTWHDKAGNAAQPPLAPLTVKDPVTGVSVSFPNLNDPNNTPQQADEFQTNLIMPEPTIFLNKNFGPVSIIRPTETKNAAQAAVKSLADDGLFIGHTTKKGASDGFVEKLMDLAEAADDAEREC
jgi:hypothetical protein